jgi:hypothetical protein
MAENDRDTQLQGSQRQESAQSGQQPGGNNKERGRDEETPAGIGASQGQDRATREREGGNRPSAGTADIERGAALPERDTGSGSQDSLVNESTGAFKERP